MQVTEGRHRHDCSPVEIRSLSVSDPKAMVPEIICTYENERTPKGCVNIYMEMCILDGSQMVRRLSLASVAEAASRTALFNCARRFVVFLCWPIEISRRRP